MPVDLVYANNAKVGEQFGMSHVTYCKAKKLIESGDKKNILEIDVSTD